MRVYPHDFLMSQNFYEPFKVFPANIKLLMSMHKKPIFLPHHSVGRKNLLQLGKIEYNS
jgi:hypothetical protein